MSPLDRMQIALANPLRKVEVTVPGSKSITNRALVLAMQAAGQVTLRGALWSEDTQVMVAAMRQLGVLVREEPDPLEQANRTIYVTGLEKNKPLGGRSEQHPLDIFVGNSGTSARFLAATLCQMGQGGWYRLDGVERMRQRPQRGLFKALRKLGYTVISENGDSLPVVLGTTSIQTEKRCKITQHNSTQFASALLLAAKQGNWKIQVLGPDSDYLKMTRELVAAFPWNGGEFRIEPDASSGSYFLAANVWGQGYPDQKNVSVANWPTSGWQPDEAFPRFLPLPNTLSRETDLGDSIMTAIVLAPLATHPVTFTDLGHLRFQECERVFALRTNLERCGAKVEESGDTLTVYPSQLHGAEIETYNDHRIAMCFAVLGLGVPGIVIKNPGCVAKTFPNFFEKLALLQNGSEHVSPESQRA